MQNKFIEILKNPEIYSENTLKPHIENNGYTSKMCLNGYWLYKYDKNPYEAPEGFEKEDYNSKYWDRIKVPGHIQIQSDYDKPQYANIQYPWDAVEPLTYDQIPMNFNPTASYIKKFELDKKFEKNRVVLSFEGVESCVFVWLNGKYVGYGEDTFTTKEFDITDYIKEGENILALQVIKWCSGSLLEDQDFFRFSGIFRDVNIYGYKEAYIYDLEVKYKLNQDYSAVDIDFNCDVFKDEKDTQNYTIQYDLKNFGFDIVDDQIIENEKERVLTVKEELKEKVKARLENPRLWSAEIPNLYKLEAKLLDKNSKIISEVSTLIGFKEFKIENKVMKINGKRIEFYGTNRHEFDCDNGRALKRDKMLQDVLNCKRNNINSIRTSHYPNNTYFYKICDILGIYVIDECNMETHAMWDSVFQRENDIKNVIPGDKMQYLNMMLARIDNMYYRDKNHASIVIWSMGNESYGGKVIYEMSKRIKSLDDSRVIHYEGINSDHSYPETTDVYTQMYTTVEDLELFLQRHKRKPMILCEYTHSMGNSNGAMHKYIEFMDKEERYQGGFIWDYVDQAIRTTDRFSNDTMYYGGDFDDRPNDGNFCGNGIMYADRTATPKLNYIRYNYRPVYIDILNENTIKIKNKMLFRNTKDYIFSAYLLEDGNYIKKVDFEASVDPLETKEIEIYDFKKHMIKDDRIYSIIVSMRDRFYDFEASFDQKIFNKKEIKVNRTKDDIIVSNGFHNISFRTPSYFLMFSKVSSKAVSLKIGNRELLKEPLMPNFWRAPIDNDNGWGMTRAMVQWKMAGVYAHSSKEEYLQFKEMDKGYRVTCTYILPTIPKAKTRLIYDIYKESFDITLEYEVQEKLPDMPEFGIIMKMPCELRQVKYHGYGPDGTYYDRHKGLKFKKYSYDAKERLAKYLRPQESGACYKAFEAEITDRKGTGIKIENPEGFGFSALAYSPHEIENAKHHYELPPINYTYLRVFDKQMGVGGDDSWGAVVHDEYHLDVDMKVKKFKFTVKPV